MFVERTLVLETGHTHTYTFTQTFTRNDTFSIKIIKAISKHTFSKIGLGISRLKMINNLTSAN